jgi:3-oxoacyl-[acyl-carrier protein] reductase
MKLQNKIAVVTGGGRGIGRAYSVRFAQEGAKVVIVDKDAENAEKVTKEIESDGGQALAIGIDIADEESTVEMVKKTADRFGGIDILINNAARFAEVAVLPWDDWKVEDWNKAFAVNVIGMWYCIKAVVPYMMKRGKGKIINISSTVVWEGVPYRLPYSCTKGAVLAMTTALARELGVHNICVNGIAPGWVPTEAGVGLYIGKKLDAKRQHVNNLRCLKRDESSEDLVGPAVFLASDDSDFVTGQNLTVDGGGTFRL